MASGSMGAMSVGNVQAVHGDGRPPGADRRDAAEALDTQIRVMQSFLVVMANMASAAANATQLGNLTSVIQIEAGSLDVVLSDLADRCAAAGKAVLELGYGDHV